MKENQECTNGDYLSTQCESRYLENRTSASPAGLPWLFILTVMSMGSATELNHCKIKKKLDGKTSNSDN